MRKSYFLALAALLAASAAWAQPKGGLIDVAVGRVWARATVPGQQTAGVYMTLKSAAPARLVGASSPLAERIEIHEMSLQGDVMRMHATPALPLPAGQAVALKPGGGHLMLMGLKQPLTPRADVPLTLIFEDGSGMKGSIELRVPVRALGRPDPQAAAEDESASAPESARLSPAVRAR